jgi:uncharacterized OB-fold protein
MRSAGRALPVPTPDSEMFWQGCTEGELRMQRCSDCSELNWFPRGLCANCSSARLNWVRLSGRGTVYSFSVVSRPPGDGFPDRYVLALVDLDEEIRMMTHLVAIAPENARIGMHVAVRFDRCSDGISLPTFAPAYQSS